MARHFALFYTLTWNDDDWKSLSRNAQGTYQMLISQTKISAAGILDITLKRWADNSSDPLEVLEAALAELTDRRYILMDQDSEELLVRTFIRWDKGHTSPTRRVAVVAAAAAVHSATLQAEIYRQMVALAQEHGPFGDGPQGWPAPSERAGGRPPEAPSDAPSSAASDTPSRAPSQAPSEAHRLPSSTEGDQEQTGDGTREPGTGNPKPRKESAAATPVERPARARDELFDALTAECGINVAELTTSLRGSVNKALKEIREVGATPGQVKVRANRFKRRYPDTTLTPAALAKHWSALSTGEVQRAAAGGGGW